MDMLDQVSDLTPDVGGLMTDFQPSGTGRGAVPKRSELRITQRVVERLRVEDKHVVFWDRDLTGFGVRAFPSGGRVYVA